jgi:hypothetical protein
MLRLKHMYVLYFKTKGHIVQCSNYLGNQSHYVQGMLKAQDDFGQT